MTDITPTTEAPMRIMLIPLAAGALLLSGCAIGSVITVDATGGVNVQSSLEVSKVLAAGAPIEATTLLEWEAWLKKNGEVGIPSLLGSEDCAAGENLDSFTVDCTSSGEVADGLNTQGLTFTRTGSTVVVSLNVADIGGGTVPQGLISIRGMVTLPGTVTSVSGGAVAVDADTVSMASTDATEDVMTGTFTLSTAVGEEFPVNVAVGTPHRQQISRAFPWQSDSRDWTVGVTSETSDIPGAVTLYTCPAANSPLDECTSLGLGDANAPIEVTLTPGQHFIASSVVPSDWWNYDSSIGRTTLNVQSMRARVEPRVVGDPRPGKLLHVALGRWSPEPTSVHYRWVREMFPEGGVEPALVRLRGGVGQRYRVVPGDVGYDLKVRITLRAAGVPPRSIWIDGPTVEAAR